jgi:hypothetical protein
MTNEPFDLVTASLSQGGRATKIGRVSFDLAGIQVVLANQNAETVAEARLASVMAVVSACGSLAKI